MSCQVAGCTGTARRHMLFTAGGNVATASICGPCLLSTLAGLAVALGHEVDHVDDHLLEPQCRHPDATWRPDGCRIDGLEVVNTSGLDVEVPA